MDSTEPSGAKWKSSRGKWQRIRVMFFPLAPAHRRQVLLPGPLHRPGRRRRRRRPNRRSRRRSLPRTRAGRGLLRRRQPAARMGRGWIILDVAAAEPLFGLVFLSSYSPKSLSSLFLSFIYSLMRRIWRKDQMRIMQRRHAVLAG